MTPKPILTPEGAVRVLELLRELANGKTFAIRNGPDGWSADTLTAHSAGRQTNFRVSIGPANGVTSPTFIGLMQILLDCLLSSLDEVRKQRVLELEGRQGDLDRVMEFVGRVTVAVNGDDVDDDEILAQLQAIEDAVSGTPSHSE